MFYLRWEQVALIGVKLLFDVITKTNKNVRYALQKVVCLGIGTYFTRGLLKTVRLQTDY